MMNLREDAGQNPLNIRASEKLREAKSNLLRAGNELEGLLHGKVGWFVNDTLKELERHMARIAFVGQMKAGKSSTINAFIQRPNFLPTDVNPSTAVITKIFFGSPGQTDNTAHFHFFTEQEWDELFSAQTQDRKPDIFSLPSTRRSLDKLRERATRRLGPNYSQILGKHHLFSAVTPQLLEQYVSTGDYTHASHSPSERIYSDITKMAELYLEGQPLAYPSVIIDTPGVNDLFFIRDEITHANLADADVYVLMLTAQQPLSSSDLSFLRLLRGLRRDKIIAVINRIDGLSDIAEEGKKLRSFVRETLQKEFPQASIPVILLSALWGNAALNASGSNIEHLMSPALEDYAVRLGFGNRLKKSGDPGSSSGNYASVLMGCSGIPELKDAISRLIGNGIIEGQLLPGTSTLGAIAHNSATSSRFGLQTLAPEKMAGAKQIQADGAFRQRIEASTTQLETLVKDVEQFLQKMQEDWKISADAEIVNLERYMIFAVEGFAEAQAFTLFDRPGAKGYLDDLFGNTLRFRSELAEDFMRHYNDIFKTLLGRQKNAEASIRNLTKELLPKLDHVIQFGSKPVQMRSPSIMPLAKATLFEMDDFKQHELIRSPADKNKKTRELKFIIASEFVPIIKELIEAANISIELAINDAIRHLRLIAFSAMFPLVQQLERLATAYKNSVGDKGQGSDFPQGPIADINASIAQYESLATELNEIKKQCFLVAL